MIVGYGVCKFISKDRTVTFQFQNFEFSFYETETDLLVLSRIHNNFSEKNVCKLNNTSLW